jgi:hypothetical protein
MSVLVERELPRHAEQLLLELGVLLPETLDVEEEIVAVVLQLDLLVLHLLQLLALALALRLTGEEVGRPTMLNYADSYQDWCLRLKLWHALRA